MTHAHSVFDVHNKEKSNALKACALSLPNGPAIISRFPIVTWEAQDLPRCGRFTDPRVLLCAELQTPWGHLQVCSTHLSGNPCQAKSVVDFMRDRRNALPLLLMGDFNALEGSPT